MADQMKLEVPIPEGYSAQERRLIADELIEVMVDQAKAGRGISKEEPGIAESRKKFPGYSKSYVESLDFKIAGKSKGEIDMTLSGDMLGAIQLLENEPGKLVIGFESGSSENDRAEGNILGSYGGDPNPRKARNFLGVTRAELTQVLEKFPVSEEQGLLRDAIQTAAEAVSGTSTVTLEDLIALGFEAGDDG